MDVLERQLNGYVSEYKEFMEISQFPAFFLQTRTASQVRAESQGYESAAITSYQVSTGQHTIFISTNLKLTKYVAFHEFTHMLDSELYVHGDKIRYIGLSAYTEYHAAQVEFAQMLGAKTIRTIQSFSVNKEVFPFEKKCTVLQYVQERYRLAIELFTRTDFPASIETLKSALGVLYNYWGLRSICEMYATDFEETVDNEAFLRFIPSIHFIAANRLMHGWLNETEINTSGILYLNIIGPILKDYKLG